MRFLVIILFAVGLLFEIAAFMGSHADNIPFALKVIVPDYVKAKAGLRKLEKDMALSPQDPGFDQIAKVFIDRLTLTNPAEKLASISVVKIHRSRPEMVFSRTRVKEKIVISFELSNSQKLDWVIESLTSHVDELKTGRVFIAAVIIFIAGVILQILAFIIQLKSSPPNTKNTNKLNI